MPLATPASVCLAAIVVALAAAACGSSGGASSPALSGTNGVVPGGVAATTSAGAPAYCKKLVGDQSLTGMSSALIALAANPRDASAKAALRSAATSLRSVTAQAPAQDRPAIASTANAIDAVATDGLSQAANLQRALTRLGQALQRACGFPVG